MSKGGTARLPVVAAYPGLQQKRHEYCGRGVSAPFPILSSATIAVIPSGFLFNIISCAQSRDEPPVSMKYPAL